MRKTIFVEKYPLSEKKKRDIEIVRQMLDIERQFEEKAARKNSSK